MFTLPAVTNILLLMGFVHFHIACSDLDLALKGYVHVAFLTKSALKQVAPNLAPGQEWVGLNSLDQGTRAQLLRQAANLLVSHGITRRDRLQYILHARVPLIKFRDARYGIDCDLSIGGDGTEYKAQFFKHVGEVNDAFAPLYCIIKLWMKAHLMNDGSTGTFNSHCLALLTVFYLQSCKPPLLPPLYTLLFRDRPDPSQLRLLAEGAQYNRDQAMEVSRQRSSAARRQFNSQPNMLALDLAGFVDFMGDVLKQALSAANSTVRLSTWYAEQQLVPPPAGLKAYYLTVEEPFDASDNCARTFGSKVRVLCRLEGLLFHSSRGEVP
ncbi:hypothetical protein DUNSADRAFT_13813 [Dunaliella salina]|uniref:Poly(A) RNA polymerase mitochondrial-like central palm domain-containing protein n=1 Tax=Dunaliella salina TaxID=3046 RepID=A0ABQ7G8L8_DUNSA|nr:hypothetical protein DUNSADRAFT_13813 [Dunaliella salina]|eukprot:KAF5830956.1 hypothetical protein DUNSADRAFT_13813 [Dunaliella salina]